MDFKQQQMSPDMVDKLLSSAVAPPAGVAFRTAESTGEFAGDLIRESRRSQSIGTRVVAEDTRRIAGEAHVQDTGLEPHWENYGGDSMLFYTVEEGKRVLMVHQNGRMDVVTGPARVFRSLGVYSMRWLMPSLNSSHHPTIEFRWSVIGIRSVVPVTRSSYSNKWFHVSPVHI